MFAYAVRARGLLWQEKLINWLSRIYTIRGVKVMLDADLAEIYGYTTKRFNEQVKNNIEKFDDDFRFQLTRTEYREILGSKFLTLNIHQLLCCLVENGNRHQISRYYS